MLLWLESYSNMPDICIQKNGNRKAMKNEITTHEEKVFANIDYTEKTLMNREFYKCRFERCVFYKSDLSGNSFEDCIFENCNFSMTRIEGASFRNAIYIGCKIMGVDFTKCNNIIFTFKFDNCHMDYSTFSGTKIKKTNFI